MGDWDTTVLSGPEGEDWRVPVSELENRLERLARALRVAALPGALVQHPVDLYYFAGGRQDGSLFVPAEGTEGDGPVFFVRRSLERARFEAGGDNAPFKLESFPRLSQFADILKSRGVSGAPGLQFGELPSSFAQRFVSALSSLGECKDVSRIVHRLREVKSAWEQEQMAHGAEIQTRMFEAVAELGREGISELNLVAAAESVSRSEGFGGQVQMRRFPLECNRGVIVSGRAGGVPSFFDSAVGGSGPHPLGGMGSGFKKIKPNEPVLVDLVHVHRGYVVDMTRMFSLGSLSKEWHQRLDDMIAVKDAVVNVLNKGGLCSQAWVEGQALAHDLGHEQHLMGMRPDQSKFLGHSVGLQLDESPVVAAGFDRPLPIGGAMAIEPKLVYAEGSIGSEDTWIRSEEGMRAVTADDAWPWLTEW
ncbi:MAG: Xaa-Pro dipeptidase [Candidatus Poseidoniaceae archaeon]|nr:MAG: Xaa-Pro dipeptidase [Candidatus Poseidoniaceae archaeon]